MDGAALRDCSAALGVVARVMGEDMWREAADIDRANAYLRTAEVIMEAHSNLYYVIRGGWHDLAMAEFHGNNLETDSTVVPGEPKARFIAAVTECLSEYPQRAAPVLNAMLVVLERPSTWAQLWLTIKQFLSFVKYETRDYAVTVREAESSRDDLLLRWEQSAYEEEALRLAGRMAALQYRRAHGGNGEPLPARPLPAERLPAPLLPASLPAEARPAAAEALGGSPPSVGGRRGTPGGPISVRPGALRRIRRGVARVVRALRRSESELEIEIDEAETDRLEAHKSFMALSDFRSDLVGLSATFDHSEVMLGELAPAYIRERVVDVIRRNQPAITRDVGQPWTATLSRSAQPLQGPISWQTLLQAFAHWMDVLSRQTGDYLFMRGDATCRRNALRLRLALLCSDRSAARLIMLGLDVLSRRRSAEDLPSRLRAAPFPSVPLPSAAIYRVPPSAVAGRHDIEARVGDAAAEFEFWDVEAG